MRHFTCNFCVRKIDRTDDSFDGIAIKFAEKLQPSFEEADLPEDTTFHLCHPCVRAMREFLTSEVPA